MPDERGMREVAFEGGPFERGLQRGRRLRETLALPDLSALPWAFVEGCRAAAEAAYPACLQEFEGIARGGGFDRDRLMAYYFARLESRLGGCTMFAVGPECCEGGEGPLVGRNYDWAVQDLRWCELHRYRPTESLKRVGYTHHWAGCPDVVNETGLYVAIASLPVARAATQAPGVQWSILVDMISECCVTVEEAIEACADVRHLRPMSYLLADATGAVAVVEATPQDVRVRRPEDGFVVAANVVQGGEPVAAAADDGPQPLALPDALLLGEDPKVSERGRRRVQRTSELLSRAAPHVSEEDVRRILQDHEAPICTGNHGDADGAPWGTIWSGVCMPAKGEFRIAPGLPCRHGYHAFTVQ